MKVLSEGSNLTAFEASILDRFAANPPKHDPIFGRIVRTSSAAWRNSESGIDQLAAAQHYGWCTRLVDVTHDPLTALYFASGGNEDADGFIFAAVGRDRLQVEHEQESAPKVSTLFGIDKYMWNGREYSPGPTNPILLDPIPSNTSMIAQRGAFVFCRKADAACVPERMLPFEIPARAKGKIRRELEALGIDDARLRLTPSRGECRSV